MKDVIIITGPTASGKSGLALELAEQINSELISADSMQIYRRMDIGTAKPSLEEQARVKHHLIDIIDIDEDYSVSKFQTQAFSHIDEQLSNGKTPIIVGGTGLYINSIVYQLDFTSTPSNDVFRKKMISIIEDKGLAYLYEQLKERDVKAAERIHPNDEKRIIRRLEILENESDRDYNFQQFRDNYNFHIFAINHDRALLYERINKRVDLMIEQGLTDEVKMLYSEYGNNHIAMKAIGYKEIIAYLNSETSLDRAIELVKQHTRNFAKRQITWFKRDKRMHWLEASEKNCLKTILNGLQL